MGIASDVLDLSRIAYTGTIAATEAAHTVEASSPSFTTGSAVLRSVAARAADWTNQKALSSTTKGADTGNSTGDGRLSDSPSAPGHT